MRAVLLAAIIVIAACTGERTVAVTTTSAAVVKPAVFPPTRTCASAVSGRPSMRRAIHIGPLALIGTDQRLSGTTFESHHGRYRAIKVLAVLRGSHDVVVTVPLPQRESVFLLYDPAARGNRYGFRLSEADAQVRFEACANAEPQYAGGLLMTEPACVSLDVHV
jgi:hypothetical protein